MLVLSRKKGQKLVINENIEIVILDNDFNSVKIGVKAPKNVSVYREEIYREIQHENELSNLADVNALKYIEQNFLKTNK